MLYQKRFMRPNLGKPKGMTVEAFSVRLKKMNCLSKVVSGMTPHTDDDELTEVLVYTMLKLMHKAMTKADYQQRRCGISEASNG